MSNPRVVIASMFMNDIDRRLNDRVKFLTHKSYDNLRWVWVVGDSTDGTEEALRKIASEAEPHHRDNITVVNHETCVEVNDGRTKMLRSSDTFNRAFEEVRGDDDYVIWHESDLISPPDLIERLLANGKDVVAGWPIINLPNGQAVFYDTWGYRAHGNVKFSNYYPYHAVYRESLFEVETAGSLIMVPAREVMKPSGIRATDMGVVDLCHGLTDRGYKIYVDPSLIITQPTDLWSPSIGWN